MAIPVEETEAIFQAVDDGDASRIRGMIQRRADIVDAQRSSDGLSVLLYAMYQGKWELVDLIAPIHPGLDIFESSALGREGRIRHLTTTNAKLCAKRSPDGWTALHLAAFFGQINAARVLIEQGADVNARSRNDLDACPLHSAAAGRHFAVCELLIADGADIDAKQHGGFTALMASAQNGDRGLAELLVKRGATRSITNDAGQKAAAIAAAAGYVELAAFLR
jgi:ankyrin repeat protein